MEALLVVACVVAGLLVGSFVNVLIWRVPRDESVVRPGSHCPECGHAVRPYDNVPVVSWVLLRGRCRDCGAAIPVRYPLVELVCGALFGLMAAKLGESWALPAFLVLAAGLVALSVIDLETYRLPNRIVFPLAGISLVLLGGAAIADGDGPAFVRALLGGLAAFGIMLAIHVISPRGLGFGDVKLAFVLGLFCGWLGWPEVFLGLLFGFLLGAVVGLALMALRRRSRKDHVPFGPFLAAGCVLAVMAGDAVWRWYLP